MMQFIPDWAYSDPTWRLKVIRQRMPFEEFERRFNNLPGWKTEYWDGKARIRPGHHHVRFRLKTYRYSGMIVKPVRSPDAGDRRALIDSFADAFRFAPEYVGYTRREYLKKSANYIDGYFGDIRGNPSPSSTVYDRDGRIFAAALIKEDEGKTPLLDCIWTRPGSMRRGLATRLLHTSAASLRRRGIRTLRSGAMLANEISIAWHQQAGFREIPLVTVAQCRAMCAQREYFYQRDLGTMNRLGLDALKATANKLWRVYRRLEKTAQANPGAWRQHFEDSCE